MLHTQFSSHPLVPHAFSADTHTGNAKYYSSSPPENGGPFFHMTRTRNELEDHRREPWGLRYQEKRSESAINLPIGKDDLGRMECSEREPLKQAYETAQSQLELLIGNYIHLAKSGRIIPSSNA